MKDRNYYIKTLLQNELMREIVSIRIDTYHRMSLLKEDGYLPGIYEEGAAGFYDNKGAIFIPGGLIYEDSDKNRTDVQDKMHYNSESFRSAIKDAMLHDNATLLFPDGIIKGVNLPNGAFIEMASKILAILNSQHNKELGYRKIPERINSELITTSTCPSYIKAPFGSRTKVSSCLGVCISEPELYHIECIDKYNLREKIGSILWDSLVSTKKPIVSDDGLTLSGPHIVVVHNTRYIENSMAGITRILGIGGFGDFATLTIEIVNDELKLELQERMCKYDDSCYINNPSEPEALIVLRIYSNPNLYNFAEYAQVTDTFVVDPTNDLQIDVDEVHRLANERYRVKNYVEKSS